MFLGSSGTLIDGQKLELLIYKNPVESRYKDKFKIYQMPEKDHNYILTADFGEGDSGDYTTCQVIDVTNMAWKQVASFKDNTLLFREAPKVLSKIGHFYNTALIVGEANTIGLGILDNLNFDEEYENLFYGDIVNKKQAEYFGVKMTPKSKKYGNRYLKEYIESDNLIICDFDTISELSSYIKRKESYSAEDGKTDDLVTPLVHFANFMQNKEWVEQWLSGTPSYNSRPKTEQAIEENLLPIGFVHDGETLINMGADDDEEYDEDDWLTDKDEDEDDDDDFAFFDYDLE